MMSMLAALALVAAPAAAQVPPHGDTISVTKHSVTLSDGRKLAYTARAGLLPLYVNDTGERMASIFFISYSLDRAPGAAPRPITFLWNGGPGSNAAQVHIVGFGPKRVTTGATYPQWGPDTETPIIDHPDTWLDTSDLVFVDPIGTGFSRATSEKYRDILYSRRGDSEATAEMIRLYLTRFNAWDQPLFLAGESYGVTRAMLVSQALERRRTHLKGVVLISGVDFDVGGETPATLERALYVPHFTPAAWYHKRLPADLQAMSQAAATKEADGWARSVYAPALAKPEALTAAQRAAVFAGLKRYTGIDQPFVDQKTLVLSTAAFGDTLLADKGLELGRYDYRMTKPSRAKDQLWLTWIDPSLMPMMDLMEGTSRVFNDYVRKDLGFESDLLYRGPFGRAFHPEPLNINPQNGYADDWMSSMWDKLQKPETGKAAPLRSAMELNPKLLVMTMNGVYDGWPCEQPAEQTTRAEPFYKSRIANKCYDGGHMWYSDIATRKVAKRDFIDFVRKATAQQ